MSTIGRTLDNRYVVRAEIGSGGFGAVYLAEDSRFTGNNRVAIKKISQSNEQTARAFQHEANLLYNLSHPNLPKVTNCFQESEANYIVMDFIAGEDLMTRMRLGEKFTIEQVTEIADRVLDALEYLHSFLIFHRDIKPHNIKIDPTGKIYLLDFGTAKGQMNEATLSLTDQSITGYTPFYAPLEQVLRVDANSYLLLQSLDTAHLGRLMENKTDARSDIYGLGATIYHLLTGFSPERATATLRAHFLWSGKTDSLPECRTVNPDIPERLAEFVHKCLEIDPADRFQTAAEARAALSDSHFVAATKKPTEDFLADALNNAKKPTEDFAPDSPNETKPIINFDALEKASPATVQVAAATTEPPPVNKNWGWYVGVPFIILTAAIFGGWLVWRGAGETPPPTVKRAETETIQPIAPVKKNRTLTYSLLVQKMRGGSKFQEPFESSGQEIFESGYRFHLSFAPPDDGFLYVFNEGLNKNNERYFSVIFPTPKQNVGSTEVKSGEQYKSGENKFSGAPGTENFWIIWSREKPEAAEQAVKNAFDNDGKIEELGKVADASLSDNLKNYLEKEKNSTAPNTKDAEKKLSKIEFEGDAIVYLLHLEHR